MPRVTSKSPLLRSPTDFLGDTSYFVNSLGFTQTLDLRESPLVAPRGFVVNNTLDVASTAFGSEVQLFRTTGRVAYFLPFGPKSLTPALSRIKPGRPLQRWFQQSSLAFGARVGFLHSLDHSGADEQTTFPIDERFFNGGATSVRSFGERDLGPLDPKGNPIGGEFYTIFNVEYTFPIYGELQGATFFDAGNLSADFRAPEAWTICVMRSDWRLALQIADRSDSARLRIEPGPPPGRRFRRVSF